MNDISTFNKNTSGNSANTTSMKTQLKPAKEKLLSPDENVLSSILNYSKSLKVIKTGGFIFTFNQN